MNRIENQVNDYPYYPEGPKRPKSTGTLGQPEHIVCTIGIKPTTADVEDNELVNCKRTVRYITIILALVIIISFTSLLCLKRNMI